MAAKDPARQQAVDQLKTQAETQAEANGHILGAWRFDDDSTKLIIVIRCSSCNAEVLIDFTDNYKPPAFGHINRRALDWKCPNL